MRPEIGSIGRLAAVLAATVLLGSAVAVADDQSRGHELYQLCTQCHGSEGQGNQLFLAPAIAGLQEWYVKAQLENFRGGLRGLHPEDVGGLRMYPMSRSLREDADLAAVAAYVASMPVVQPEPVLEGGDPAKGAALYQVCTQCHGPDAAGNEALRAPSLQGANDWYLLSSLQKFKAGIRGGNPQNTNAVLMRGMSMTLTDEQAMKDVIAHIESLAK